MTQPSLPGADFQLRDAPNGERVANGKITFDASGKKDVVIPPLPAGAYRIVVTGINTSNRTAAQEVKQEKIFLVASSTSKNLPVNLTAITTPQKNEYAVGETASVLLGSGFLRGAYVVELWAGDYFIKNIFIDTDKPVQTIDIPVTAQMKGGFAVRWFGVKDIDIYHGETLISVPWSEKKLTIALDPFSKDLAPGEKPSWGIQAKDPAGNAINAEALVFMYDRSLEYYGRQYGRGFDSLFTPRYFPANASHSDFIPWTSANPLKAGPLYDRLYKNIMPQEKLPSVYADRTWLRLGRYDDGYFAGDDEKGRTELPSAAPAATGMALEDSVVSENKELAQSRDASTTANVRGTKIAYDGASQTGQSPEARKAFADTAFFLPHIKIVNGKASFSFTAPEQLTSWRIKAMVLTSTAQYGSLEAEAVTKKDLMVRLDLPRFFREKDKGTVTVMVHNESDKVMTGTLKINVLENGASIAAAIKLNGLEKPFTLQPHSLASFDWSVEIPGGVTTYTVRAEATATAGDTAQAAILSSLRLTDAEERSLPILPSRERLMESAFALMKGTGTYTISIPAKADPTRITESAVLKVDPQLALSILNSIPFLIDYPHPCVEQTLNRYVPLAIVSGLYAKFPEVKAVVDKLPRRDTVTPPWEKDNPERMIQLQETPWGWESEGRPSIYPVIDLLDPAIVTAYKETTFAKLVSFQKPSGGFPWMPGGQEDIYMTLYVLDGLSQVHRYGGEIPADMVDRAIRYVTKELSQNQPEPYRAALVAYAAYVVTSFPKDKFSSAADAQSQVKNWKVFLEENIHALTPLGKAYLASIYFGLGETKKGDELLETIMSNSQIDPVAGLYWTPEEYSWVWYSDSVEKHAFIMRLLMQQHPDDKRIDAMAQWLLWNRKGSVWKSTKASAAAIYCLLDYMKKGGALLSDETFTINWGGQKEIVRAAGDSWQKDPILIDKPEGVKTDGPLSVFVEKQGKGTAFASLSWTYTTDQLPEASGPGLVTVGRAFYVREKQGSGYTLRQFKSGDTVKVGDQIVVKLTIRTKSQFEYMHLRDPKAAGFEAETLTSGWKYSPLWFYEEPRDSGTNFFFNWLPHGEYVLSYMLRPTKPGEYRIGAATLQSMYAPELTAHSDGFIVKVAK
ncbi:MAG: hypothetical protein EHM28_08710 [Spirochaetaceae bacterium]|nr:MAG: hypothetical protein EHM28_08710 [Spirochaetaceae bacterium]